MNGKTSGKSLTAFVCVCLVIVSVISAIIFSNGILPEYFWWGLLSLIGGLFGLKTVFGKNYTKINNTTRKNKNNE
jgi:hypothetical protein